MEFEETGSYYHSNILVKAWRWRQKIYGALRWLQIVLFHRKDTLEANDMDIYEAWGLEMGMADARMGRTLTWREQ